jgi:methylenetetrahydrofolate reductase (NADPH)
MKVIEHLERANNPLISYEIIPPKRGGSAEQMLSVVEELMPYDPPFIDVTSHSAEVSYKQMPDGGWKRCVKRKRPGTLGLCAAIEARFGIDTVPHLLCRGFTREETEDALIELNYLGIDNVLAIRGDDKGYDKNIPNDRSQNEHAGDLVRQIQAMNHGEYLEDLMEAAPTDFCIGVGGYPEKHFEAPNLTWDIMRLKKKLEAGAHYVVTQMFFDNEKYFNFVEQCRNVGIDVPIIPGLKIITSKRHIQSLPRYFHTDIPEELVAEIDAADPEHVEDIGIEWARKQTEELMSAGVPCTHFYIMSSADSVKKIVEPMRELA